jgi:putative endonuclease
MALHNELGEEGEKLAVEWLQKNGYEIVHRNWRHGRFEIDIIASKGDSLRIIEVKARNDSSFGYPEDSVSRRKFKNLQRAADEFLFLNPGHQWIQYDILSITMYKDKATDFFLLEDVFL